MHQPGYRVAQLGAVLMIVGGVVDMSLRELLPHHAAMLSVDGPASDEAAMLVMALLRALGGSLAAAGLAVLFLLHFSRRTASRFGYAAAALIAILAEGPNALGILSTGSPLFLAPTLFMVLVVTGCALCYSSLSRGRISTGPQRASNPSR